jgi:hypothetical protein
MPITHVTASGSSCGGEPGVTAVVVLGYDAMTGAGRKGTAGPTCNAWIESSGGYKGEVATRRAHDRSADVENYVQPCALLLLNYSDRTLGYRSVVLAAPLAGNAPFCSSGMPAYVIREIPILSDRGTLACSL